MPRFFPHLTNGFGEARDNEGVHLPDQAAARVIALDSFRDIVAAEAPEDTIDLTGRIYIADDARNAHLRVPVTEAFAIKSSDRSGNGRIAARSTLRREPSARPVVPSK